MAALRRQIQRGAPQWMFKTGAPSVRRAEDADRSPCRPFIVQLLSVLFRSGKIERVRVSWAAKRDWMHSAVNPSPEKYKS